MRKLISLLAGLTLFLSAQAQMNPIKHMDITVESIHKDTLTFIDNDTIPLLLTHHKANMLVDLVDVDNISSVEVILGSTDGTSNLLSKSFNFSTEGIFTDGTSYSRQGNLLNIGLGLFPVTQAYFASVKLHLEDGSYSSPLYFSIQY
ncbi:MAG: hypothetical protein M0D57_10460 [Sphingobacteriales bacterium JAD_PAG50586_3]|nr:MAG: hypothetical protein M0D57_10460 [Sphingobacteriales bacterium JAD_PAG50586_3]